MQFGVMVASGEGMKKDMKEVKDEKSNTSI